MTADQRAELNKCIMKNGPDKKLSLSACEKIAKDLSLTLEQVCMLLIYATWFFLVLMTPHSYVGGNYNPLI